MKYNGMIDRVERADVLIIGSEAAGAKAAIEAQDAGADVLVVTKGLVGRTGDTIMAGKGIQAAIGHGDPRDNPDVFMEDVVKGGDYLNNQKLVERLTKLSVTECTKMEKSGASFVKDRDKFVQLGYPGSTYRGLLPTTFNGGIQWRKAFKNQFKRLKTRLIEDVFITKLLKTDGQIAGAFGINIRDGKYILFKAKNTILATGGCPAIYRKTDASIDATGDGLVLAYEAGAELMDMEFQQFFPLCCYTPPFEMSQYPAELRYYLHARFYNSNGDQFMEKYMPDAKDWGLKDPTSRAIYMENKLGHGSPNGGAWLSINHLPDGLIDAWLKDFKPASIPGFFKKGIDVRKYGIECGPGAHYTMGGVRVNENCETGIPRLWAAGEVAGGMDGAERIDGGPAITWCLGMGYITGTESAKQSKQLDYLEVENAQIEDECNRLESLFKKKKGIPGFKIRESIRDIMYDYCALIRNREGMEKALKSIQEIKRNSLPELSVPANSRAYNKPLIEALEAMNQLILAEIIIKAALMREETRKSHFRTDYPDKDNVKWLKNIIIKKNKSGMKFSTVKPIMTKYFPPEEKLK